MVTTPLFSIFFTAHNKFIDMDSPIHGEALAAFHPFANLMHKQRGCLCIRFAKGWKAAKASPWMGLSMSMNLLWAVKKMENKGVVTIARRKRWFVQWN